MHKIHDHETSSLDSKNNNQRLCEKRKSLIQLYGTVGYCQPAYRQLITLSSVIAMLIDVEVYINKTNKREPKNKGINCRLSI